MVTEQDVQHFANTFLDITENIQKVVPMKSSDMRKYRLLRGIRDYEQRNRQHITLSDISRLSGIALPNVNRYLKPFEEAGYIVREKNGRTVSICITPKGNGVIAGHLMDVLRHITLLLNSFPEDELPDFLEKCDKFSETIHAIADKKTGEKNVQDIQESAAG